MQIIMRESFVKSFKVSSGRKPEQRGKKVVKDTLLNKDSCQNYEKLG